MTSDFDCYSSHFDQALEDKFEEFRIFKEKKIQSTQLNKVQSDPQFQNVFIPSCCPDTLIDDFVCREGVISFSSPLVKDNSLINETNDTHLPPTSPIVTSSDKEGYELIPVFIRW